MTLSDAASLLHELRERAVDLEVVGERMRFRPIEVVTHQLRERLAACKPALLAILHSESFTTDAGDGERPCIERCRSCHEPDFVRPRAGGGWRCARCRPYDLPGAEVEWWPRVEEPFAALDELVGTDAAWARKGLCACCGGANWWRLDAGTPWVCSRCHPSMAPADSIETLVVGEAAS